MDPTFKPRRIGMILVKERYPCGCTPKPKEPTGERKNDWALGYDKENHTMK